MKILKFEPEAQETAKGTRVLNYLTVEDEGVEYKVKIPAFCDCEEKVKEYLQAYIVGKKSELDVEPAEFNLSKLVNKEV